MVYEGEALDGAGAYIDLIGGVEEPTFSLENLNIKISDFFKNPAKSLRKAGAKYFYKHSRIGKTTIENPGSWEILDLLYGNEPENTETGTFTPEHWSDKMFFNSGAAKATRARFRHYVEKMEEFGEEYARENNGRVSILSLASGPGRDVMEVMEYLGKEGIDVYATCVDISKKAMETGSRIAKKKGLKNITFKRCNVNKIHLYENDNSYHILITQGIMDYLRDKTAINLIKNSRGLLKEGGTLITSNMDIHKWMRGFMEFFGGWKLIYRSGEDLEKLMIKGGYEEDKINVYLLPERFHWIGIGKK